MTLLVCQKCGSTYVEDADETHPVCSRCKTALVEVCEWCNQPEKQCTCGKDEINLDKLE
jgi:hypothetical protein